MAPLPTLFFPILLLLLAGSSLSISPTHFAATTVPRPTAGPLSPRASLLRYWARKIPTGLPMPPFLLSKASPLSAPLAAVFDLAASSGSLPSRLHSFCSSARLLCFPDYPAELDASTNPSPSSFSVYSDTNFSNYGTAASGGVDSFRNYSDSLNVPLDSFRRYSRGSDHRDDRFASYSTDGNVVTANFTSYATSAKSGSGDFSGYAHESNVPDLRFTNYDAAAEGRRRSFSSYSDDTNSGGQSFAGYGKGSTDSPSAFSSYAANANVVGSSFSGYGESASNPNDTFTSYGFDGNVPTNTFRSYADGSKGNVAESFSSYRDQANVGDDSFRSYAKGTRGAHVGFKGYGQSANVGIDSFKGYAVGSADPTVTFRTYGPNSSFADYRKGPGSSATFADYRNTSSSLFSNLAAVSVGARSGRLVNRWVEPGKFFRESQLAGGTVMPMPNIRDRMPSRAFLPRSISTQLPFSSARLPELNRLFNATEDTALWKSMVSTVAECEREPSRGETKRCARSIEEMVDFATSVLGSDVVVRTTESTAGSGRDVEIGRVHGVNGGRVTRSVSCHQSLFPFMVYYCHSVPRVRVYEAEILAVETKEVINRAVAICHLDTSAWSAGHAAFVALGPAPGKIEVCHWIFEGDMTWAVAD